MNATETVARLLRPLAERREMVEEQKIDRGYGDVTYQSRTVLDPRFDVLRQPCWYAATTYMLGRGYTEEAVAAYHASHAKGDCPCRGWDYVPITNLGAIVRAAAACGLYISALGDEEPGWFCALKRWQGRGWSHRVEDFSARGSTPEEALARALVAAVAMEIAPGEAARRHKE